jgi:H+/gluconate symporter-like permease
MDHTRPEPPPEHNPPTGIAVALGSAVIVVSAFVSAAVPASVGTVRLGPVAVALAGFAALTVNPAAVAAVGGLGFLVFDGFLVNQLGELSWHGPADVRRLMVLAAAGVLGIGTGTAYRAVRRMRAWRRRSEWIGDQVRDVAQPRDASPLFDGVLEWKKEEARRA